ncbi:hypothetical protein BgiBS90_017547 [Biomphalaria glabrata]|nr:hypothetical protein BgiBS90_017547 [Biomphalaria glabrata]
MRTMKKKEENKMKPVNGEHAKEAVPHTAAAHILPTFQHVIISCMPLATSLTPYDSTTRPAARPAGSEIKEFTTIS